MTAFLLVRQKQQKRKKHFKVLVICPKNLRGSWEDEMILHLRNYQAITYNKKKPIEFNTKKAYSYVLVGYEAARINIVALLEIEWDFVILDESHRIKNRKSKTAKALWKIK